MNFQNKPVSNVTPSWVTSVNTVQTWSTDISFRTRLETPTSVIPNSFYEPIVYQFMQRVYTNSNDLKFIISKVTVVDPLSKLPILKDGKPILAGSPEIALVYSEKDKCYTSTTKIQFTTNSFNCNGKEMMFQISYFTAGDPSTPVIVLSSTNFKVYARKPYTNRTTTKKTDLKRKSETETQVTFPLKGQSDEGVLLNDAFKGKKVKQEIQSMVDFKNRLEELVEYSKNDAEKQDCIETVFKCFLKVDPRISTSIMLSNLQTMVDKTSF